MACDSACLQGRDKDWARAVVCRAVAELAIRVPAEGVECSRVGDRQRVRVAAAHAHDADIGECADLARQEDVAAVAVAQTPEVAPVPSAADQGDNVGSGSPPGSCQRLVRGPHFHAKALYKCQRAGVQQMWRQVVWTERRSGRRRGELTDAPAPAVHVAAVTGERQCVFGSASYAGRPS